MLININKSEFTTGGRKYITLDITVDNKEVQITKGPYGVNVLYKNAMHKVYRGIGKSFDNIDLAIANYKDRKIVIALEEAKEEFNKDMT